ncbi:transposase, partial [Sphingomonas faeni]|uniref:transposase n=1 Tax=Sphingomonas faeni TaxID=185950 RepID=UPI0020C78FD6
MGAPSVPPGRYFRMLLIGYFEGIYSERGIVWRCSDSLSLREFLRLATGEKVPDHSWMSKTRSRLPHAVHDNVFNWVLALVADHDLVKVERIGVDGSTMDRRWIDDGSTMEANAALHTIVPRDTGETYREMLTQMARESGIETPSADWESPIDPDAKVARMKNGATRMAYKPEQAVDLDAGVIVAAPIHPADRGDTNTLDPTLEVAKQNLAGIGLAPTSAKPCVLIADKGHHSRERLKRLDGDVWKTRIAGPKPANGILRWHGDVSAQ